MQPINGCMKYMDMERSARTTRTENNEREELELKGKAEEVKGIVESWRRRNLIQ